MSAVNNRNQETIDRLSRNCWIFWRLRRREGWELNEPGNGNGYGGSPSKESA